MSYVSQHFTPALSLDRATIQARAERMRGEEMRRLAGALKRRIAAAFAGLSGRHGAGQAV